MAPLIRCPYCGFAQDEPQGVKKCRNCGGDLTAQLSTGHSVFVCYSRRDREFADRLTADLRAGGVSTWRDVDNIPADAAQNRNEWDKAVERALQTCSAMVVVLSPDSVESREVQGEWSYFKNRDQPIFPVIARPCDVPFRLSIFQVWDLTTDYKARVSQLAAVLGPGAVPKPSAPARKTPWALWAGIALVVLAAVVGAVLLAKRGAGDKGEPPAVAQTTQPAASAGASPTSVSGGPAATSLPARPAQPAPTQLPAGSPLAGDLSALGGVLWRLPLAGEVSRAPTVGPDGTLYVVTHNGMLQVVEPGGTLRWQAILGGAGSMNDYSSPVVAPDGRVLVVWDGYLLTFAPDGTPGWTLTKPLGLTAPPAVASDGTVFVMTNHSVLWAISAEGGDLWSRELCQVYGGGVWPGPAVASDGTVYAVCKGRDIYALDPASGDLLWTYNTNDKMESTPATGPGGQAYFVSTGGWVFAMDRGGKPLWTASVAGPANMIQMVDAPAVFGRDGLLYVTPRHGTIYALDPADGVLRWSAQIGGQGVGVNPVAVSPAGYVYALNLTGELSCHTPQGEVCWQMSEGAADLAPPAAGLDGELYVGIGQELVAFEGP